MGSPTAKMNVKYFQQIRFLLPLMNELVLGGVKNRNCMFIYNLPCSGYVGIPSNIRAVAPLANGP